MVGLHRSSTCRGIGTLARRRRPRVHVHTGGTARITAAFVPLYTIFISRVSASGSRRERGATIIARRRLRTFSEYASNAGATLSIEEFAADVTPKSSSRYAALGQSTVGELLTHAPPKGASADAGNRSQGRLESALSVDHRGHRRRRC